MNQALLINALAPARNGDAGPNGHTLQLILGSGKLAVCRARCAAAVPHALGEAT